MPLGAIALCPLKGSNKASQLLKLGLVETTLLWGSSLIRLDGGQVSLSISSLLFAFVAPFLVRCGSFSEFPAMLLSVPWLRTVIPP